MAPLRRVAFVFPPTGAYCREDRCQSYFTPDLVPAMRPPLEETAAAAGVRRAGGTALLVDAPAEGLDADATLARVAAFHPDLVSLTITWGSLEDDLAFAERVRARLPGTPIGLRGGPCYGDVEALLRRHPVADFAVRGDYELVYEGLARDGLAGAPGVVRREGEGFVSTPPPMAADLDTLPWADRSLVDASRYVVRGTQRPQATVHVQRGCPFPCTYCLVASVSGRKARHRSPDDVAREVAALVGEGYRFFYLRAETLTLDRHWAKALGHALHRLAPEARWVSATRVDTTDEETLAALARGGCYGLSFGVETGSADIGKRIRKVPDLAQTREVFRACDRQGIASLMYVMLGFLWETPATQGETEAFVHAARPDLLTLYWAHPYPGTPYHAQVEAQGLPVDPRHAQAESALEPPALPRATIRRRAALMTARHYARPQVLASVVRKLWPVLKPTRHEAQALWAMLRAQVGDGAPRRREG